MTSQLEKKYTDENQILIQKILSGNLEYVQKTLSTMFSRGHFPNIRANGYGYRSMWQEEISQEIFIIFHGFPFPAFVVEENKGTFTKEYTNWKESNLYTHSIIYHYSFL